MDLVVLVHVSFLQRDSGVALVDPNGELVFHVLHHQVLTQSLELVAKPNVLDLMTATDGTVWFKAHFF